MVKEEPPVIDDGLTLIPLTICEKAQAGRSNSKSATNRIIAPIYNRLPIFGKPQSCGHILIYHGKRILVLGRRRIDAPKRMYLVVQGLI